MATTASNNNLVLNELVRSVRDVLALEREPGQMVRWVGGALRPFLGNPHLLSPEQREPDPTRYRQHILHAEEDGRFSIVALVWLPGQATPVHDHVAWCVIGIHQGQEREVQYEVLNEGSEQYLLAIGESTHKAGSIAVLQPPGDVHTVYNPGPELAISLHIYGADVRQTGSSIRCRYDLPVVETLPRSFRRYAVAG
ncbi:MAG TPA: cysteine dioxygenase family protein [Thermoanaerobaculia bacterium]|nr:cysteine dioxygenase family protein [Thermoanaerobaculia bacterium]